VERLLAHYRALPRAEQPALWFTYHLYHKAPDHIGPVVARQLGIPYVLAEASYAAKQARGPSAWCAPGTSLRHSRCRQRCLTACVSGPGIG